MYWVSLLENHRWPQMNPHLYGHEDCTPGQSFGFIRRPHWMIYYVDVGCGRFYSDEECYNVTSGDVFLVRPGANTKIVADEKDPWTFHWVGFDGSLGEALWQLPLVFRYPTSRFAEMDKVETHADCREMFLAGHTQLLICEMIQRFPGNEHVRGAKAYLRMNYMRPVTMQELAEHCGLVRNYLSRVFRSCEGMTPQQYLEDVRMQQAVSLLQQGETCAKTAELVGYRDASVFSRAFSRHFGYPPSMAARNSAGS